VPSQGEWAGLLDLWRNLNSGAMSNGTHYSDGWGSYVNGDGVGVLFMEEFLLPYAGYRAGTSANFFQGTDGRYWSSTPYNTQAFFTNFAANKVDIRTMQPRAMGFSVRCFKDVPDVPVIPSVPVLTGTISYSPDEQSPTS
jgi:uncharacterized protein (TIGR02145 family)